MKSYLQLIQELSEYYGVPLLAAVKYARVPTSTYYRTINGTTELRYETALKISEAIEKLYVLKVKKHIVRDLQERGLRVDMRSVNAEAKRKSRES